jgi:hypothetical protein
MSDVPAAREIIEAVLPDVRALSPEAAERLEKALGMMTRRRCAYPPAPVRSAAFTPEKAAQVRRYKQRHPRARHQDIANRFSISIGRVSEALHHDR